MLFFGLLSLGFMLLSSNNSGGGGWFYLAAEVVLWLRRDSVRSYLRLLFCGASYHWEVSSGGWGECLIAIYTKIFENTK